MTKVSLNKMLSMVCVAGLGVGCAAERDVAYEVEGMQALEARQGEGSEFSGPAFDEGVANLDLDEALLRGRIGDVGVDDDAWVDGYADGAYASIYSSVDEARNGAVMTIVEIDGGLFHDDLAAGAEATFEPNDVYNTTDDAVFVTVVGCSGPTSGAWDFDQTAESVTIRVEGDDEGARVFNYTARFDDGYGEASVVTGAFSAVP